MKKKVLFILLIVSVLALSSCRKSQDVKVPLLAVENNNILTLENWDVKKNSLEISDKNIVEFKDFIGVTYWDGENKLILTGDVKKINKKGLTLIQYQNNVFRYKDTTLENIDKNIYKLTVSGTDYTFDLEEGAKNLHQTDFDIKDFYASSYIVNGDNIYILMDGFSDKMNAIELTLSKVNYKTGDMKFSKIKNSPGYSPAIPPTGGNILQKPNGFIAFNDYEVTFIDAEQSESKVIIRGKDLPKIPDSGGPSICGIGFHKDYLLIMEYHFYTNSESKDFRLHLIKGSDVISSIDITGWQYLPNI